MLLHPPRVRRSGLSRARAMLGRFRQRYRELRVECSPVLRDMRTPSKRTAAWLSGVAIWGFLLPAQLHAQTSGAAFLKVNPSARAYSLGMANTVSALGAQAFGANPANLGLIERRFEAFSSYSILLDGAQYEHLAVAMAAPYIPGMDSIGVAVTRLQQDGFVGTDSQDNHTGASFSAGDMAVSLGAAGRISPNLRVGLAAKAIQSELAGYKSNTALAVDLGTTYTFSQFSRPLSVGFSVTNLGQGIKFLNQVDPLPSSMNLGMALPLGSVLWVAEVNRSIYDQKTQLGTGVEIGLGHVAFRGGLLAQNNPGQNLAASDQSGVSRLLGGISGGVGLRFGMVAMDYAISQQAVDYGATQRLSLTLWWGDASEHTRRAVKMADSDASWKTGLDRSDWVFSPLGDN